MRLIKAYYYACISFVDFQIERILDTLEETDQLENTLILFSSDHGEHLGDRNSLGKRSMHDSSSRIPMIVRQPGRFDGGRICETPVNLVDLAPTFLSAAGNKRYQERKSVKSHTLDGVDMFDILSGASERKIVFSQLSYWSAMTPACIEPSQKHFLDQNDDQKRAHFSSYMAVSKEYKYIYSAPDNKEFFFDRNSDPYERRNRAGVEFLNQEKEVLKKDLLNHLKDGGETAGISGEDWKIFPEISINDDPDTGLLIQDGYTPWANMERPREYR